MKKIHYSAIWKFPIHPFLFASYSVVGIFAQNANEIPPIIHQVGLLSLFSELQVSRDRWMEWRVRELGGETCLSQTGFFEPRGFWGFAYWIVLGPIHQLGFRGLFRAVIQKNQT